MCVRLGTQQAYACPKCERWGRSRCCRAHSKPSYSQEPQRWQPGTRRVVSNSPYAVCSVSFGGMGSRLLCMAGEWGLLLNVQPGPGFPRLPSALPGSNEINTAKKRQIGIDGLQSQKQLNTLISADVIVLNQLRLCRVWPCLPPQWSCRSVCVPATLPG